MPRAATSGKRRAKLRPVVPDRVDFRDRPYQPAIAMAPPAELNSLALHKVALPVMDQDQTSACTGFGLASVVNFLLRTRQVDGRGPKRSPNVSPYMLYSMARRYDEFPGTTDTGSSLRGALKGWFRHGASKFDLWKTLAMPKPKRDPKTDWWQDAARRPLGAYYRLDIRSITDMHVALTETGIVYASVDCHEGWDEGYDLPKTERKGWTIPVRKVKPDDGGHAFAIVGYDARGFLILNSWGTGWGDGGFATLKYEDWLDNAMDCWVAQLGVATDLHLTLASRTSLRVDRQKKVQLAADEVLRNREISPFVVNMENNGRLSNSGRFRTNPADLGALFQIHLPEARRTWGLENQVVDVAIYAHGGLNSEEGAAKTAARWIPRFYDARIFPIFLMWETDLWSTLRNVVSDALFGEPKPAGGLGERFARWWNKRLERTLAPVGKAIWDEIKENAQAASSTRGGGARLLAEAAGGALSRSKVRLHLIGHSAGAILHCHLLKNLTNLEFSTVSFAAPAATLNLFENTMLPALRGNRVDRYYQFHLTEEAEENDPTCRPILGYGRSLLYLVSESFEHGDGELREQGRGARILGMKRDFDPWIQTTGHPRVQAFSTATPKTRSTTHGGFDEDEATTTSVVELIQASRATAGGTVAMRFRGSRRRGRSETQR